MGIVVEDLAAATAFFVELGLKLLGEGHGGGRLGGPCGGTRGRPRACRDVGDSGRPGTARADEVPSPDGPGRRPARAGEHPRYPPRPICNRRHRRSRRCPVSASRGRFTPTGLRGTRWPRSWRVAYPAAGWASGSLHALENPCASIPIAVLHFVVMLANTTEAVSSTMAGAPSCSSSRADNSSVTRGGVSLIASAYSRVGNPCRAGHVCSSCRRGRHKDAVRTRYVTGTGITVDVWVS